MNERLIKCFMICATVVMVTSLMKQCVIKEAESRTVENLNILKYKMDLDKEDK